MMLYAIDPGTEQSAVVTVFGDGISGRMWDNHELVGEMRRGMLGGHVVIEEIASYGMPVGREVFQTCIWIGRFIQVWQVCEWETGVPHTWSLLPRKDVKLALCGSPRAKDANIRQALIDRYGGKAKAVGTKKQPGPLYGIRSHCWAALALAVTYQEKQP